MALDIYLNVAVSGLLTGLVYGLMALGLALLQRRQHSARAGASRDASSMV